MATVTRVIWNPTALNAAIARAYTASLQATATDAEAHSPTPRAGARAVAGGIEPTGDLGTIMEKGARPHVIAPDPGKVLFLKGINVFSSGPVDHPGSPPQPYLGPAAMRWARGGFQAIARAVLMGAGFR
jgi:hypothetical protein